MGDVSCWCQNAKINDCLCQKQSNIQRVEMKTKTKDGKKTKQAKKKKMKNPPINYEKVGF